MFKGDPKTGGVSHLTHARGSHSNPRNNHLGDAHSRSSLRTEKRCQEALSQWVWAMREIRLMTKSEQVKMGWPPPGVVSLPNPPT